MTAPETFTTASKQPLTKGRRPDMAGICAKPPAEVDINRSLRIEMVDVAVGGKRPGHASGFTGCMIGRIAGN
jgi:hypothetical protein